MGERLRGRGKTGGCRYNRENHLSASIARITEGCSKRLSSKAAASEEARRTLRYVESLSEARTPLAGFFSIRLGGRFSRSGIRYRHDVEILLGDQLAFHQEAEFIATGCRKDEKRDVDAEIGDLETVIDLDVGKSGSTDQLFRVEIDQVDIKVIEAFGVGEAEVESHMLMVERERSRLKMREDSDQAFLFGEAILNDLVADQKRLHGRLGDICHRPILEKRGGDGKTVLEHLIDQSTQPRMAGPPRMSRISPKSVV